MGIETALIAGAVIGGVTSMAAASKQAKGAKAAAGISAKAGEQGRADLAPWRNVGESALYEMSALMGLPGEYPGGATGPVIDQQGRPVQNGMAQPPAPGGGSAGGPAMMITDPRYVDGELVQYGDPRWGGADPYKAIAPVAGNALAQYGRGGDTEMAHVTPGETVVPESVAAKLPGGRNALADAFRERGVNPGRYVVGGADDSINPATGIREFPEPGGAGDYGGPEGGYGGGGGGGDRRDTISRGLGALGGYVRDRAAPVGEAITGFFEGVTGRQGTAPREETPGFTDDNRDGGQWRGGNAMAGSYGIPTAQAAGGNAYGYGLPEDYYSQENALARFRTSPGYEFRFGEGARALEHSAAARGDLFSGNQMRAITEYGQNYASGEYGNYWNRLAALAGGGQASAAGQAGLGMQTAGMVGNSMYGAAQAGAQGIAGVGSSINSGINNYLFYQALQNGAFR